MNEQGIIITTAADIYNSGYVQPEINPFELSADLTAWLAERE